ncbi:MAG: GIY-YIG nuclease family protein [Acidimicrobiales bacterium]
MERPPDQPGVYFLVEADGELRYIGKATSLRNRLGEHARSGRITASTTVHWEVLRSEDEAVARESDLIVFLKPLGNRAHVAQDPDVLITVPPCEGQYGTFPHLAKGAHTSVAKRMKAGSAALQRVVADGGVDPRVLHDLLAGRSDRMLDAAVAGLDPVRALARERDIDFARDFYRLGPRRLRALRLRHDLPVGPVAASTARRCLMEEVRALIGDFHVPEPDEMGAVVGRRRAASMKRGTR